MRIQFPPYLKLKIHHINISYGADTKLLMYNIYKTIAYNQNKIWPVTKMNWQSFDNYYH